MTAEPIYAALAAEHTPADVRARRTAILASLDTAWTALDRAERLIREDHADGRMGLGPVDARALILAVTEARASLIQAGTKFAEVTAPTPRPPTRRLIRTWDQPAPTFDSLIEGDA